MEGSVETLSTEARKLSPVERAALVEAILQSLDTIAPELERAWTDEAKDRLAAYRRGEIVAKD